MDKEELLKNLKNSGGIGNAAKKIMEQQQESRLKELTATVGSVAQPVIAPRAYKMPDIKSGTAEEQNHYQSASIFMESLAKEALEWKSCIGDEYEPAIIAILHGGMQINVQTLSQVSFHGIRIEGLLNGAPCTILAHQSTVQMLCHAVQREPERPARPIGFIWEGNEVEV